MIKKTVFKVLALCSFLILIGGYVAFRYGVFEFRTNSKIKESTLDSINVLKADSISHKDIESLPDSLLREIYMSSSKVIRVIEPSDLDSLFTSVLQKEKLKPKDVEEVIKNLTEEREKLEKSANKNNPVIISINAEIKRLKASIVERDSLNLRSND